LFTSEPPVIILEEPTYWENNPESPHIYGGAADIAVEDHNQNGLFHDDWDSLAAVMVRYGINPINMGDSTYIHAQLAPTYTPMVSVEITPSSILPGRQDTYNHHPPDIIRELTISGGVDSQLAPYQGDYLTLSMEEVPFSGGHNHTDRPMNHDPEPNIISGELLQQNSGSFNATYEDPCQWGGQYQVGAYYHRGSQMYCATDTFDIRFPGLVLVDSNEAYDMLGAYPQHQINHYTRLQYKEMPLRIVEAFDSLANSLYPGQPVPRIWLNDMCLVCGGRFDIGPTTHHPEWELWNYPHNTHRIGCSLDIGYYGISKTDRYYRILGDAIRYVTQLDPKAEGNCWHAWFCIYSWR
jgi:hypothetical protein